MAPYEDYSQIHQPSPTDEEEECASIGHAARELWYYVRIREKLNPIVNPLPWEPNTRLQSITFKHSYRGANMAVSYM
jgi:hypothetical protein